MAFELLGTITDSLFAMFGGAMFLPLIIIGVLSILVLSIRGGKALYFLILVPMVTTLVVWGVQSPFFAGLTVEARWIPVVGWLALGFIMTAVFWKMMQ